MRDQSQPNGWHTASSLVLLLPWWLVGVGEAKRTKKKKHYGLKKKNSDSLTPLSLSCSPSLSPSSYSSSQSILPFPSLHHPMLHPATSLRLSPSLLSPSSTCRRFLSSRGCLWTQPMRPHSHLTSRDVSSLMLGLSRSTHSRRMMSAVRHDVHCCVVGSGPAGIYLAEYLLKESDQRNIPMRIDIVEKLPFPFGLVRYGVGTLAFSPFTFVILRHFFSLSPLSP